MRFTTLESVTEFVLDGTHGSPLRTDGGVPVLSAQNVNDGELNYDTGRFTSLAEYEAFHKRLPLAAGDVLLTIVGSIGRAAVVRETHPLVFQRSVAVLRPRRDRLHPTFLYHVSQSSDFQRQLKRSSNQSSQAGVYLGRLKMLQVPVPSLSEQRRIAGILDKAAAVRGMRSAAQARLEVLIQSFFAAMFGDSLTNPMGWPIVRLEEVTECLDRHRRPVTEVERTPGGVPYFGANGQQGWIDKALFDEPLVLVAEDGGHFDQPHRGVAYRIDGPAWVNNHAHVLRARGGLVDVEFLHRALRNYDFLPYISGTTRAKLTQGQLNSAKIFVPPLSLQQRFTQVVRVVNSVSATSLTAAAGLDNLFRSLQHTLFDNQLGPRGSVPTGPVVGVDT